MIKNRDKADVGFSVIIILFGLYVVYGGIQLSVGSFSRIGPGFFPVGLGAMIASLGFAILFEPQGPRAEPRFNLRGLVFVSLGLFSFAVLVETVGLFPAIAALVLLTNLGAEVKLSPIAALGTIVGLCAVGYVLFIAALNLPFSPFADSLSWAV